MQFPGAKIHPKVPETDDPCMVFPTVHLQRTMASEMVTPNKSFTAIFGGTFLHSRAYPGTARMLINIRFNWPQDPFVHAWYAFRAPQDIPRCGPVLENGIGDLDFAGEHTCYAFVGYTGGALQSGIRVCNRVMGKDGLAKPLIYPTPQTVITSSEEPMPRGTVLEIAEISSGV